MTRSQQRRVWMIVIGLAFFTVVIVGRLIVFQVVQGEEWRLRGQLGQVQNVVARPERGLIYDRNGSVLAANGSDYQVGVSPNLVYDAEEMATALAPILQRPRYEILGALTAKQPYALLANRVAPEVAEAILALDYDGLQVDPLPRRIYPQGELMCHVLGYVDYDGHGGAGLEGYYQADLAGEAASASINISPLTVQESVIAREGADVTLTIDRSVQYVVEQHLARALQEYQAESGTIIVMDPRTGAILAMATLPCYEPYLFYEAPTELLLNPLVSQQYEPGSVMKLITMAAALDSGAVTPQTTYNDVGYIELGGHIMYNWDRSARGVTDMTHLLAYSLNVGAATIASWMGPEVFYNYLERFGFGRPTGVDLMAEIGGQMSLPGDEVWTEAQIGTNAFGQGLAVTPLQMISAASALANDGYLMEPYLAQEIRQGDEVFTHTPNVVSRPISADTAHQVTAMATIAVRQEVYEAQVENYTVAGKTGTAQIAEGGVYLESATIGSFIGWLPADAPEMIVLVKLDRPQVSPWGSMTAAPTFAALVDELVVLLGIPPDDVRLQADIVAARGNQ
ncbi:MAG: penicillin-binding protein 2 [Chloroflexota bacterium]